MTIFHSAQVESTLPAGGKLNLESELVDYRLLLELDQPDVVRMLPPPLNEVGLSSPSGKRQMG